MKYKIDTDNFTTAVAHLVATFNEENARSIGKFQCAGVDKKTGDTFKLVISFKRNKA